ncbi:hypothetical protein GQ42DRAFT_2802 [Ramicandelaber brevisporus]|nr:hypothetical protein GQ42DRAFT_2802 [Ramicandelaber brevisporus]
MHEYLTFIFFFFLVRIWYHFIYQGYSATRMETDRMSAVAIIASPSVISFW